MPTEPRIGQRHRQLAAAITQQRTPRSSQRPFRSSAYMQLCGAIIACQTSSSLRAADCCGALCEGTHASASTSWLRRVRRECAAEGGERNARRTRELSLGSRAPQGGRSGISRGRDGGGDDCQLLLRNSLRRCCRQQLEVVRLVRVGILKTQNNPCAPGRAVRSAAHLSVERTPAPSSLTTSQCTVHLTPHE